MRSWGEIAVLGALVVIAMVLALTVPRLSAAQDDDAYDVPYVPTPMKTVTKMLEMAKVSPGDIVYDLGSGDGRIPIAAVRDFGAQRGIGVDINPVRVREANENLRKVATGLADKVRFDQGDVFDYDFSEATVLTMYLLTEVNLRLRPKILSTLKPGTRVVSHDFDMGEWEPDDISEVDSFRHVFMWVVPAQVEGTWDWSVGNATYSLALRQFFQRIEGSLEVGGQSYPVKGAKLSGTDIGFSGGAPAAHFEGKVVAPGRIEGTVEMDGKKAPFIALKR